MNLVDYCKVPEYYDELKVGDKIMFIEREGINTFGDYIRRLYDISYNKLYEIIKIENMRIDCGSASKCTTDYLCITVKIDSNFSNEINDFLCCGLVLANKLGQELKIRKKVYEFTLGGFYY